MPNLFEAARVRELYLYNQPPTSSQAASSGQTPRSSTDTALSAFAQLVTLRLGARRALISVFDKTDQHILAEATRTLSLQSDLVHNDEDELWFGFSHQLRSDGLCELALATPSSTDDPLPIVPRSSPFFINDILKDDSIQKRPFVISHPSVRFFASVPIRTKSGFEIGAISVMDERPRDGVSQIELAFLKDMAITVMDHFHLATIQESHRRGEKMVKGLGLFVEGRSHLREWWLDSNATRLSEEAENESRQASSKLQSPTAMGSSKKNQFKAQTNGLRVPSVPVTTHIQAPKQQRTDAPGLQESVLSANLKDMFSRASNIIRECIEVDGSLVLDASIGTFGGQQGDSYKRHDGVGTFGSRKSYSSQSDTTSEQKKCGILGFSTEEKSCLQGDEAPASFSLVPESFLHSLVLKYPRGQVFDLDEEGLFIPRIQSTVGTMSPDAVIGRSRSSGRIMPLQRTSDSSKFNEAKAIVEMLPGARSVAFSPLWDSHRERFFAASFAWTTQSTRVLRPTEDLNYLAAFGNSMMVDVARLDAIAADQAKSDFISSISHELRTPLHGILASVEFLQDTTLDLFQISMIDTVERCGRTLLDTIQHVLDFAKINTFSNKAKSPDRTGIDPAADENAPCTPSALSIDIDLSVVTEDVIDSMHAGHQFQHTSSLPVANEVTSPHEPAFEKRDLEVIMDIGWRPDWAFNTQSGALRRILMNLLGNALRYTDDGWVKISLQAEDLTPKSDQSQAQITLGISDSGRGISPEFLQGHLFTPFIQESSLNPGTGLGMSIVRNIVHSLGGTIDVASEQGVGTSMTVSLTLTQVPVPQNQFDFNYEHPALNARKKTDGLSVGLVGFESDDVDEASSLPSKRSAALLALKSSLETMITAWFGMRVATRRPRKRSLPDIYIVNELSRPKITSSRTPIIVLCSNAATYHAYAAHNNNMDTESKGHGLVHLVSKPCGPHKLAKAFEFCLDSKVRYDLAAPSSPSLSTPLDGLETPQSLFRGSPSLERYKEELNVQASYFPPTAGSPARNEPTAIQLPTVLQRSGSMDRSKPFLLLVEDNKINMRLLETFMIKNNFEYDTAVNGLLAVQAFQKAGRLYDIIFMDISMPVMDGLDASREIRKLERERKQKSAKIFALTGLASAAAQQEAFSRGINLFMTKPVRFNDLRIILNEWTPGCDEQE